MPRSVLAGLALAFCAPTGVALWIAGDFGQFFAASAGTNPLLKGCGDVPEAMALADELARRSRGIERYLAALEEKRAEIARAEASLRQSLQELKQRKSGIGQARGQSTEAIRDDVDRLVAVFDQMKPAEAAAVMANLPTEFAAEILMRLRPENGARIMAAVDPRQAAMLTAQMGARSIRRQ